MKLNINFECDPATGKDTAVITDDRGERMPCIRAVTVDHRMQEATVVTVEIVVDQRRVTLGSPPKA